MNTDKEKIKQNEKTCKDFDVNKKWTVANIMAFLIGRQAFPRVVTCCSGRGRDGEQSTAVVKTEAWNQLERLQREDWVLLADVHSVLSDFFPFLSLWVPSMWPSNSRKSTATEQKSTPLQNKLFGDILTWARLNGPFRLRWVVVHHSLWKSPEQCSCMINAFWVNDKPIKGFNDLNVRKKK